MCTSLTLGGSDTVITQPNTLHPRASAALLTSQGMTPLGPHTSGRRGSTFLHSLDSTFTTQLKYSTLFLTLTFNVITAGKSCGIFHLFSSCFLPNTYSISSQAAVPSLSLNPILFVQGPAWAQWSLSGTVAWCNTQKTAADNDRE